jgi:hypothetical protein
MERPAILIQMSKGHLPGRNRDMAETIDLLCIGAALRMVNLKRIQVSATTAREKMAGGMSLELQVLQIMVVTGHVQVDVMLAE